MLRVSTSRSRYIPLTCVNPNNQKQHLSEIYEGMSIIINVNALIFWTISAGRRVDMNRVKQYKHYQLK